MAREVRIKEVTYGNDRSQVDLLLKTYAKILVEHHLRKKLKIARRPA